MPATPPIVHAFDCPKRATVTDVTVPNAAATNEPVTEGDGRSPEREIISISGHWSNCDVHIAIPQAWIAAQVELRIYARHALGRSLIVSGLVNLMGLRPSDPTLLVGTFFGLALQVRGHPCDGFEIQARTATTVSDGKFVVEVWGCESEPEGIAQRPGAGIADEPMAQSAACMLGLATSGVNAGKWVPVSFSSSGTFVVTGDDTPSDAFANPVDAVTTWSLTGVWNGATWERWQSFSLVASPIAIDLPGVQAVVKAFDDLNNVYDVPLLRQLIWGGLNDEPLGLVTAGAIYAFAQQAGGSEVPFGVRANNAAAIHVLQRIPDANIDTQNPGADARANTVTRVVSAIPARLLSFDVGNEGAAILYFQIHNKAAALAAGDVPVYSFGVGAAAANQATHLTIGHDFLTQMGAYLSAGLTWGWSTTRLTYTAAGAFTGIVNVNFIQ